MKTFEISQTSFLFSGRCGSVELGRVGRVGLVGAERCGTRWVGANRSVRVGLRRRRQAGLRVRHGGAPDALPTLSRAPCLELCHDGCPSASLRLSCVQSGCSWGYGRHPSAPLPLSCARRCGLPTPPISPCRLLHALPLLLLLRLRHLLYCLFPGLFYVAYSLCSSAASVRCGSMSSASSVSLGT